jgi:hypothetical protein
MSPADDERSTLSTINADTMIPVYTDGTQILWDGNDATIAGLLYELSKYFKKVGRFQQLVKNRAVTLGSGKLAIEDFNTVLFLTNKDVQDAEQTKPDFSAPSPSGKKRLDSLNDVLAAISAPQFNAITAIPDEHKYSFIFAPHSVEEEDSKLLNSLSKVVGHCETADDLIEQADGSGLELLRLLKERSSNATARDKALVSATFDAVKTKGVVGELTCASISAYVKAYKAALRNLDPNERPPALSQVQAIVNLGVMDKSLAETFDQRLAAEDPKTMDECAKILKKILIGRLRSDQIAEVSSGRNGLSLFSQLASGAVKPKPLPDSCADCDADVAGVHAALASIGIDSASLKPEQLAAMASAYSAAVPDPRKTAAGGGDKPKVEVPRDDDGKPLKWVEGMATCRCGINGGKHLFKDCPKKKDKEKRKKDKEKHEKALAAAVEKAKAEASAPSPEALQAAVAAFFGSAPPSSASSSAGSG